MEKNEYLTPEHLLYTMLAEEPVENAVYDCGGDVDIIKAQLEDFFSEKMPKHDSYEIAVSNSTNEVFEKAARQAASAGKNQVELPHVMKAITDLKESYAVYYLIEEVGDFGEFLAHLNEEIDEMNRDKEEETRRALPGHEIDDEEDDGNGTFIISDDDEDEIWEEEPRRKKRRKDHLRRYVTCLNETVSDHNPLIGREKELERTIQVLCCRDKNNPLHIGEAGVGKTSITYGLAARIVHGQVPDSLKDARIFLLDLNAVVAGAQYRGQFEQRIQEIMNEIAQEKNPIVFIDEIHTIVGAGDYSGSTDAASLLKPWFEDPHVRFIGSTTYEDYNRSISKNKTLIRRFQNIDIEEPSAAETIDILEGIRDRYEKHHGIIYGEGFMEEAVSLASRYMSDRFLPDKAIALIDEAGAILQLHPELAEGRTQEGSLIAGSSLAGIAVSRICHIPETRLTKEAEDSLLTLKDRISSKVFGQDEAISQMVYAVQTSRLGLQAEHKPVASLLFVGPTGVGKTESAKVLAAELGVSFLRFDMSEYT
ncbi:MAG: AAA family ATPase, partial [Lachnospiraceae bacterium]|nr:AAA family ATPase [Lachnospiraceae bacterium]